MRAWACKVCRTTIIEYTPSKTVSCRCRFKLPGTWQQLFDVQEEEEE